MTGFSAINTQQGSLFGAFYSNFRVLEAQGGTSEEESKQVGRAGFSAIKHSAREPIWGFLEQIAEKAGKRSRSLEKAQKRLNCSQKGKITIRGGPGPEKARKRPEAQKRPRRGFRPRKNWQEDQKPRKGQKRPEAQKRLGRGSREKN